jgi:hypothetical protein
MSFFSTARSSTPKAFKVKKDHLVIVLRKAFYGSGDILVFSDEKGDARKGRPQV